MKASISVIPDGPVAGVVELAVRAEGHGFERCWIADGGTATRDVYVVMVAVAGATREMMVGPGVTGVGSRLPSQTAVAVASVGEVTGGRVMVGLGGDDLPALAEGVATIRALLSGDARLDYAPVDTEIWVAGRHPELFELGGAIADGVLLDFVYRPELGAAAEAVRRGGPAKIAYRTSVLTSHDDPDFLRSHLARFLVDGPEAARAAGVGDADLARLREALDAGRPGAAGAMVLDEWIDPFVIGGSVLDCANTIRSLALEHGIDEFVLPLFRMPAPHRYLDRIAQVVSAARRH